MDDGNAQIEIAATVDAVGLLCPLPVLRARKRLQALAPGAVLRLLASDPAAVIDVPHFCTQSGHEFLGCTDDDGHQAYLIRKTA
ncbi:sulfurtransferase TusA family protein [Pseudodonghicola xiamenensis]|nr:sulfurtransferase TusA family protein [Pseudodonghicola xiamenensis]